MNILYYGVCKTNADLQHITIIDGYYSLSPDIILSAQMSSCTGHELTKWNRFSMIDANLILSCR